MWWGVAYQVKVLATTHSEPENQLLRVVLCPPHGCHDTLTHKHTKNTFLNVQNSDWFLVLK